ncbi:MAG TPA: CopG family transcriptional regulator [Polyangia bacterium]|nr:CopG family transcriptional regulator [Polyangia bacterium]
MSKRLQVILDDEELLEVQRAAKKSRMTTAEWVRQALRRAQRAQPRTDVKKKLAVVRAAVDHAFPTADIDQMIAEIERGYVERGDDGAP